MGIRMGMRRKSEGHDRMCTAEILYSLPGDSDLF